MARNAPKPTEPEIVPAAEAPEAVELHLELDRSKLLITDLTLLSRARRNAITDEEAVAFFDRVLIGGVSNIPLDALPDVWKAIFQTVYRSPNAKN